VEKIPNLWPCRWTLRNDNSHSRCNTFEKAISVQKTNSSVVTFTLLAWLGPVWLFHVPRSKTVLVKPLFKYSILKISKALWRQYWNDSLGKWLQVMFSDMAENIGMRVSNQEARTLKANTINYSENICICFYTKKCACLIIFKIISKLWRRHEAWVKISWHMETEML
jgi:hypothetical protein